MNTYLGFLREQSVGDVGTWSACVGEACMVGTRAWWSVTLNRYELDRRDDARPLALRRLDVADLLLTLPLDKPVAESSLSAREFRRLETLPSFLVEWTRGEVVRRAQPSLRVNHVAVPARTFRRGLTAASSFLTYCPGSMVLPARTALGSTELAEASYYGVGVYRASEDGLVELLAPEPMPAWPETAASWVFSETLCEQLTT